MAFSSVHEMIDLCKESGKPLYEVILESDLAESGLTRAEACTIVNRVLGRKPSKNHMKISGRIDWPDCTTADWFYEAIMEATNSHTYQMGKRVETWNDKLPQRDWAALEKIWSRANSR